MSLPHKIDKNGPKIFKLRIIIHTYIQNVDNSVVTAALATRRVVLYSLSIYQTLFRKNTIPIK